MSAEIALVMAMHCHQPVGNFGFVFEEAYANAYDPFLQVLERHPTIRLALHYSGSLLDWLREFRPQFLERVARLVRRGQVELLASGYYEPILPLIPEADRQAQIRQMREALRSCGEPAAEGLWLTERVWEPDLPLTLSQAGLRYTIVDTNQFLAAKPWLPPQAQVNGLDGFWDLLGYYATDYAGHSTFLFPASKRLRYWMPFQPVERTIEFLNGLRPLAAGGGSPIAVTVADDGEKFGLWPSTHQWVYGQGWLDRLFTALERQGEWLTTMTFRDYLAQAPSNGRVSLPSGSYEEMLEWSGGHFRNFFIKYPEANSMLQKMLHISQRLQNVSSFKFQVSGSQQKPTSKARNVKHETRNLKLLDQARQELYAGQCNCAYWHGVFGGLYLSHLRRAVYARLLAAEALADQALRSPASIVPLDSDADGRVEIALSTGEARVVIDPDEGGTITEWSLYGARINLLDTLTRRPEPYHRTLTRHALQGAVHADGDGGQQPSSIHEALGVKEHDLASRIVYDDHRRSGFVDYAFDRLPSLAEVLGPAWAERRLWSSGGFRMEPLGAGQGRGEALTLSMTRRMGAGTIGKTISLGVRRPTLECRYAVEGLDVPVVGIEFTLSLRDERYLAQPGAVQRAEAFELSESAAGVALRLTLDPPATVYHFPVETVSESEEGMERTYQGLGLLCLWATGARGRPSWTSRLRWVVETG